MMQYSQRISKSKTNKQKKPNPNQTKPFLLFLYAGVSFCRIAYLKLPHFYYTLQVSIILFPAAVADWWEDWYS